jgi:hypothetical protein
MKFYSEITNRVYDTTEELEVAEKEVLEEKKAKEEKLAQRAERAKKVEEAYALAADYKKKADELLNEFVKDYGSFHTTIKTPVRTNTSLTELGDLFDSLFKFIH